MTQLVVSVAYLCLPILGSSTLSIFSGFLFQGGLSTHFLEHRKFLIATYPNIRTDCKKDSKAWLTLIILPPNNNLTKHCMLHIFFKIIRPITFHSLLPSFFQHSWSNKQLHLLAAQYHSKMLNATASIPLSFPHMTFQAHFFIKFSINMGALQHVSWSVAFPKHEDRIKTSSR